MPASILLTVRKQLQTTDFMLLSQTQTKITFKENLNQIGGLCFKLLSMEPNSRLYLVQ